MLEAILIIASYLIGSIPFAYIIGKLVSGIDIRKTGDGNVGAANAYREIGPWAGILVMVLDIAKGIVVVFLVRAFTSQVLPVYIAGAAVVAGHAWPVFLRFKGGRGEATASGVLVVLLPAAMLSLFALALIPFIITRNTMLLGVILFLPLWLVALLTGQAIHLVIYSAGLPCLVGINHLITSRHLGAEQKKNGKYMKRKE